MVQVIKDVQRLLPGVASVARPPRSIPGVT